MTLVINYVVGEDISWERMELMDKLSLVGRFMGKSVSVRAVCKWVEDYWLGDLGVVPEVEGLARGWYAFNFHHEDHLLRVLNHNWFFEQVLVFLKRWHPHFDASHERVDLVPT